MLRLLIKFWPIIIIILVAAYFFWDSYAIKTEKLEVPIEGLPANFDGFKIAHLSDIHGRNLSETGDAYKIITRANPDAITISGDFVTYNVDEMNNFIDLFRKLSETIPIFAVSGNHDHDVGWAQVKNKLRENGVMVLENEYIKISRENQYIVFAGVNDPSSRTANLQKALPETEITTVLLVHSPRWFEANPYDPRFQNEKKLLQQVSLSLAGHTHGGQIKIPFVGPLTTASGKLFPKNYIEGLYREGDGWLYITRGLGYVMLPFRFLSDPEIAILTLRRTP